MRVATGFGMVTLMPRRAAASVSLGDLRDHLGAHVRRVRRGGEIIVLDRGKAVARIVKYQPPGDLGDHLASLVARGLVRPPKAKLDPRILAGGRKKKATTNYALEALLADRYDD